MRDAAKTVLQAEGITKSYGGRTIIQNISLTLGEGELVCLLGVSGAGKTTLFNVLSGLERPDGGRVLLKGQDITSAPGKISYMLQKDLLLPHKKVADNVALPLVIQGQDRRRARETALSYFGAFGLEETQDKYPAQLSGGMRQRAALLRTFLGSQGVALLDEPFSALDALTKREIHQWYMGMMDRLELATLFITHDIDEAVLLSDRVCILSGQPGQITAELTIQPPRPRNMSFALSEEFLACKRQILSLLDG
ncbi:ABC transporter ATP-binding protein [Flintibacter muris]|uniref:ABC transporter ATP-binding protein n=1 Tax=Flintibacter muris TaxID=2941327 RepID=UPI0020407702|nr:ABC transporter ATP-binding protein [Flintibacter muris]